MSSIFGDFIKISIFGESHGNAIGITLDGLPAGESINFGEVTANMQRRAPGNDKTATSRKEYDSFEVLSGILNDKTTGTPLCAIIKNNNIKSSDYSDLINKPRPGHADFTGNIKYKGFQDVRGGGHFSGRLTAPLTFGGSVCRQILKRRNIDICAHIYSIENIYDDTFCDVNVSKDIINKISHSRFPLINQDMEPKMRNKIENVKLEYDSLGGIIECAITGISAGIGSPMFYGIENVISSIIFGIPAVKGIEFGLGFESTKIKGSQNNDSFYFEGEKVKTKTNNCGGILGGISTGMPIIFRVAVKPTPSISKKQNTVDLDIKQNTQINVKGRHDPCIVPRAVPVVESAAALAIINLMSEAGKL